MDLEKNIKGIALIVLTLFFVYSFIAFGLCETKTIPYWMPIYDDMFYHSRGLLVLAWICIDRFKFESTKLLKPVTICFHISLSYWVGEITGAARGQFSVFSLAVFFFMLAFLAILTIQRERIKWSKKLQEHEYLYKFIGWTLTFRKTSLNS